MEQLQENTALLSRESLMEIFFGLLHLYWYRSNCKWTGIDDSTMPYILPPNKRHFHVGQADKIMDILISYIYLKARMKARMKVIYLRELLLHALSSNEETKYLVGYPFPRSFQCYMELRPIPKEWEKS